MSRSRLASLAPPRVVERGGDCVGGGWGARRVKVTRCESQTRSGCKGHRKQVPTSPDGWMLLFMWSHEGGKMKIKKDVKKKKSIHSVKDVPLRSE